MKDKLGYGGKETHLHQFHDEIHFPEVLYRRLGSEGIQQLDDVGVADAVQQDELPVGPLGRHRHYERLLHLLDGHLLPGHRVVCHPIDPLFIAGSATYTTVPWAPALRKWRLEYLRGIVKLLTAPLCES